MGRDIAMGWGNCFKGRQVTADVILWAVRWYLMFPVSYRDLELMLRAPDERDQHCQSTNDVGDKNCRNFPTLAHEGCRMRT